VKILGISGSLRRDSYNTGLLRAAAELVGDDVELELLPGLKEVPPYDHDDDRDPAPAAVAGLRSAIAGADAVLFAVPEYNSSIPGVLKNALDWVSRPLATNALRNRPVAVVGASTGIFGAVWAQAELRKVLAAMGARVLDVELPVTQAPGKFEDGRLADDAVREQLATVLRGLVDEARVGSDTPAGRSAAAAA
jgi:chromate reductase, NAD(P)H dehydrogenase (quinone)